MNIFSKRGDDCTGMYEDAEDNRNIDDRIKSKQKELSDLYVIKNKKLIKELWDNRSDIYAPTIRFNSQGCMHDYGVELYFEPLVLKK